MIGLFSRFAGLWLIAGGLVALVIDATKTVAASALVITPLGLAWSNLSPASLMSTQEFVQRKIESFTGHWIWDPLLQWVLFLPAWAVLGAAGFLLTYLGRQRRRKAAYG